MCQKAPQVVRKCVRMTVQGGHMVVERGVKPLCYHLHYEMRCTSIAYPIFQYIATLTHYFSEILCEYIKHFVRWMSEAEVLGPMISSARALED